MRRWWREPRGEVRRSSAHWLGPRCRRQPVLLLLLRGERSPAEEAPDEGATPARGEHLQRHGDLERRDPAALGHHVCPPSPRCLIMCAARVFICVCVCRKGTRRVRELWWQGLPPSVRGRVWSLAIGNELNITAGERALPPWRPAAGLG